MSSFFKQQLKSNPNQTAAKFKVPEDGKFHAIRILPFDDTRWSAQVMQHWAPNPSADTPQNKGYICPMHQPCAYDAEEDGQGLPTYDMPCPFCDRAKIIEQALEDCHDKEQIKILRAVRSAMTPTKSFLLQIESLGRILDDGKRADGEPGIVKELWAAKTLYAEVIKAYTSTVMTMTGSESQEELMNMEDSAIPDLFDWESGHAILIRKFKESNDSNRIKFEVTVSGKKQPVGSPEVMADMRKHIVDPITSLKKMMDSGLDDMDEACASLEKDTRRKAKTSKGGSTKPDLGSRTIGEDNDKLPPPRRPAAKQSTPAKQQAPAEDFVTDDPEEAAFIHGGTTTVVDEEEDFLNMDPSATVDEAEEDFVTPTPAKVATEVDVDQRPPTQAKAKQKAQPAAEPDPSERPPESVQDRRKRLQAQLASLDG